MGCEAAGCSELSRSGCSSTILQCGPGSLFVGSSAFAWMVCGLAILSVCAVLCWGHNGCQDRHESPGCLLRTSCLSIKTLKMFANSFLREKTVFSGFFRFAPVSSGFLRFAPVSCFRLQTVFSGSFCSVVSVNVAGQAAGHHGHCLPPAKGGASVGPVQAEGK